MTPEQSLQELRKALAVDERLCTLLRDCAKRYADAALRLTYSINEPSVLIRQSGVAEGAELFIKEITKSPKPAQNDRA